MASSFIRGGLAALAGIVAPAFAYSQTVAPPVEPTAPAVRQIEIPPIEVQGHAALNAGFDLQPDYAGGQVANGGRVGLFGNQSLLDTPFSTTNFTREQITNQNASTVNDVVANDPSVRIGTNHFSDSEVRTIRGFTAIGQNTTFLGLPGMADFRRPRLEGIERVELLEGPSTLLNGAVGTGNVGGVVNLVPKRAMDTPTRDATLSYTSRSLFEGLVDVGERFGPDHEWGARVNISGRSGATPIDRQFESGSSGTAALDYRGERLRISLDLSHHATYIDAESQNFSAAPGIAIPKAPPATRNIVGNGTDFRTITSFGVAHADYDVTDSISVFGTYGFSRGQEVYNGGFVPLILDSQGSASVSIIPFISTIETEAGEFGAHARVNTGFVAHRLSIATDRYDQLGANNFAFLPGYTTSIYNPIVPANAGANAPFNWHPSRSSESKRISYAVADTLSVLEERVLLTVGARLQYLDERNFDTAGATTTRYRASRISPAAALVVKLTPEVSLYGNYIEQLNPGNQAPIGSVNAGAIFAPFVSVQKEVGVKYDFGRIFVTAALFEIAQPQGLLNTATNVFGVDGEQRNRGLELKTFGEIVPGVRLLGGVAFIDGKQTKTADPMTRGKTAVAVPVVNIAFGAEWDIPYVPNLTLTGGTIYSSKSYVDTANTQTVPGYARFDIGARYTMDRGPGHGPIVVRGGIQNVTGNDYWQATQFGGLGIGSPRTFYLATTISL